MANNMQEMRRLTAHVRRGCEHAAVSGMGAIHRGTIERFGQSPGTPVLTARTRSGGRVGINADPTFVPPVNAGSYPAMTVAEAEAQLSSMQLGDALHWIQRAGVPSMLEDGYSPKAPDGYLELSTDAAKIEVEAMDLDKVTS